MPKGGARPGAGNPGYGKLEFIRQRVTEFSPLWWEKWEMLMRSKNKGDLKFAMDQFNKLQVKMIPQQVSGLDDGPIQVEWLSPSPINREPGRTTSTVRINAG